MAEGAMAEFLGMIQPFFDGAIGWVESIVGVVTTNPVLTVMVIAMPVVGFAVGLLGRLIRL